MDSLKAVEKRGVVVVVVAAVAVVVLLWMWSDFLKYEMLSVLVQIPYH